MTECIQYNVATFCWFIYWSHLSHKFRILLRSSLFHLCHELIFRMHSRACIAARNWIGGKRVISMRLWLGQQLAPSMSRPPTFSSTHVRVPNAIIQGSEIGVNALAKSIDRRNTNVTGSCKLSSDVIDGDDRKLRRRECRLRLIEKTSRYWGIIMENDT